MYVDVLYCPCILSFGYVFSLLLISAGYPDYTAWIQPFIFSHNTDRWSLRWEYLFWEN